MAKPVEVKALADYRIWLKDDDGTEGVVDLSDLAGRGVFEAGRTRGSSSRFELDPTVRSSGGPTDACPDAMYMRLTGKTPEEVFPTLRSVHADA